MKLTDRDTMEKMLLSPFDDHEELRGKGIFRASKPNRPKGFGEFLATNRSEDKLTHVVRKFLLEDQEGKLVNIAPRPIPSFHSFN